MTRTVPNFSAWEIALALVIALSAQVVGLLLLRTGGGSGARADISDERARPMSVSITPIVDDAPVLKLGSKRDPGKLPDRWVAPRPVERTVTTAAPSPHAPPAPKSITTAATPDAGPAPPPQAAEPVKEADLLLPVPDAGPVPVSAVEGAPDGVREGTETDPLKAHARDLYKSQLTSWFKARFTIRGKIPFDTLKGLRATAVVNIGPDRTVTGFTIVDPSGNRTFDSELNSSLTAIVTTGADVPAPPPMYPEVLQSTQRIEFRCTVPSACE